MHDARAPEAAAKKKSVHAVERESERVLGMRKEYLALIVAWASGKLKFVDETGINLTLTRGYGRAARGTRVCEGVPHRHIDNVTVVAALGLSGLSAPWQLPGAMDTDAFEVWVDEVLCPTLSAGDIVVMDNLKVHKVASIRRLIEARGARLEFLPPYSPDLNPIEKCWSKLKTYLRKAKARTHEALEAALKNALATVTPTDIAAWFRHCGYGVPA